LSGIAATLEILVGLDVVEIGMGYDERDDWDGQYRDRGVVDTLRA
jgi:hypothetical protein